MENLKALAASWARSFLAAAVGIALYQFSKYGEINDPMAMLNGGVAAVLPVVLRWLNPKDSAFGLSGK